MELHPYSPGPCTSLSLGAFPRYRYDQLMGLGRKVFLPLSLAWVVAVSGVSVTFPWLP
ncbi:hypothetical protein QN277_021959 [Acacia crassicarpa]|uniref:Uncharacterized protein n=1 Tax=Acacia crassicarpa TaxID=499986 RepID=A0AAE1JMW8_9FABA|nr:hypothetical protein QN277_021959 [Acacia crassicarpa]